VFGVRSAPAFAAAEVEEGVGEGEEEELVDEPMAGIGATGKKWGVPPAPPRPERRATLRASISWRRATFSDLEDPNSERIASRMRSRSAMSPSRVVIYSINQRHIN